MPLCSRGVKSPPADHIRSRCEVGQALPDAAGSVDQFESSIVIFGYSLIDVTVRQSLTYAYDFVNHGLTHRRMDYSLSLNSHLPIGIGAIESAVRRVINLRVKSNATHWLREIAETIIRFRAWIKAGRAEEFFHQTTYVKPTLALKPKHVANPPPKGLLNLTFFYGQWMLPD